MKKRLKLILGTAIKHCKKNKFYADCKLSKDNLARIYRLSSDSKTIEDLVPAFNYIFELIGDQHAHIRDYKTTKVFSSFRNNTIQKLDHNLIANQKFESKRLNKTTGYLKIVGIHPKEKKAEAKKIRSALIKLSNKKIENWVIDLRYNTGGHFESMMAGLSPLFKDGTLAKIIGHKGEILGKAKLKNRKFSYFNLTTIKLPKQKKVKSKRISILLSQFTSSSGELVAVCFKGRKNTRFFGEATAGKTTNTSAKTISKELILILSTGYLGDCNNNIYSENIPVDVPIPFYKNQNSKMLYTFLKANKVL